MKKLLTFFCLMAIISVAGAQSVEELMASAQRLRNNNNEGLALTKYNKVLEQDPDHYEALHSASFLYSRLGHRLSEKDKKSVYFRKAKDLAARAKKANPTDAEGYFVMSVAMGRIALIAGSKERVAASADIKENAETAIRYKGDHAGAWHILGRWNVKVANLSFAERAAANVLFGGLPEGASNENAINCYQNALKYNPGYVLYMYDLAGAYVYNKQKDKARAMLKKVIAAPPKSVDDPAIKEEAAMMLESL
ncbi:MAG: tetratricopeptide repeat protein [Bacteroidota bacterium]